MVVQLHVRHWGAISGKAEVQCKTEPPTTQLMDNPPSLPPEPQLPTFTHNVSHEEQQGVQPPGNNEWRQRRLKNCRSVILCVSALLCLDHGLAPKEERSWLHFHLFLMLIWRKNIILTITCSLINPLTLSNRRWCQHLPANQYALLPDYTSQLESPSSAHRCSGHVWDAGAVPRSVYWWRDNPDFLKTKPCCWISVHTCLKRQ